MTCSSNAADRGQLRTAAAACRAAAPATAVRARPPPQPSRRRRANDIEHDLREPDFAFAQHGRSFADRADAGQHIFDLGRRDSVDKSPATGSRKPKTKGAAPSCRPCAHAHASLRCQWSTIDQQARLSANSAIAIVPLIDAANIRAIMVSVVSKAWTACGCPMWFEFYGRSY